MASYAKQHGVAEWKLYQWRSRLVRDGLWPAKSREAAFSLPNKVVPVQFARVGVTSAAPVYIVRLELGNGRRAEIEIADIDPLVPGPSNQCAGEAAQIETAAGERAWESPRRKILIHLSVDSCCQNCPKPL